MSDGIADALRRIAELEAALDSIRRNIKGLDARDIAPAYRDMIVKIVNGVL